LCVNMHACMYTLRKKKRWLMLLGCRCPCTADNTGTALKSFYKGPWACTNTWQGNGCSGNLEGTHNTWHQAIGGDVVWLAWATYDPLFW
jgi:hypothetical protein